jgi:hypothetical protein
MFCQNIRKLLPRINARFFLKGGRNNFGHLSLHQPKVQKIVRIGLNSRSALLKIVVYATASTEEAVLS